MKKVLVGIVLFSSPTFLLAQTLQGRVTRVSDGDTLHISVSALRQPIKVRLQGIDAPEICQAGGEHARVALRTRLLRQNVTFTKRARDPYGRVIARVEHSGQDVGAWLVSHGHAWSDAYRSNPGPYADEQKAAQKNALGLWAQRAVTEPKQWRKINGACPLRK